MTRRLSPPLGCALALSLALTACSSSSGTSGGSEQSDAAQQHLTVLIATSGDAETRAVRAAAAAFEDSSGHEVTVEVAKDMDQQLGQAFAGNKPPDVFYVGSDQFANYARGGSLLAYGEDHPDAGDFSEGLLASFTYEDELVCVPKDVSTLGLVINTDVWEAAGLTDEDHPTTWDELREVASTLTGDGTTGLVLADEYQRIGAFMKQSGGWITDPAQGEMTADSPENLRALEFVQDLLDEGVAAFAKDVDAGWGGEAFGTGRAAMTIEGNWIDGAMKADYPDVPHRVVPLPAGPAGPGTLAFSTCWGIAADSPHQAAALDLVTHLTSVEQQLAFADAFGVMPSRTAALEEYTDRHPGSAAWAEGLEYAQGPVTVPGFEKVARQFNTDLQALRTAEPAKILADLQRNGTPVLARGR
ncbi:extracellular solute-binding protein [Streptomyces sp. ACA25]|uniref:extracellular solute-binding protein n=1 Tax=Streptomyces sp. ACA25 TaxID=3022596 RepID=UPI00230824D0|nr:extracellular solute-binding protein [Streptomyces sp. ACA25]MDB1088702.1 extracellular solute-binding protein [Streptomyces sp. ACA25]